MTGLHKLLNPRVAAVIGVSTSNVFSPGNVIFRKLAFENALKTYPINPKGGDVEGVQVYPSITKAPDDIDLAVISIPAISVPSVLEECGNKGIEAVVVVSGGFSETQTKEGIKLQQEIVDIANRFEISLVGPNCIGVFVPDTLDTFFLPSERVARPRRGSVAIISQSGGWLVERLEEFSKRDVGIAAAVSIGNAAQTKVTDFVHHFEHEKNVKVIVAYLEGFGENEGREFVEACARYATKKPVIVYKGGVSEAGHRATMSHTSALGGSSVVASAAFRQFGVIEARDEDHLMACSKVFSFEPIPMKGPRVGALTVSGGHGVIATDEAALYGLEIPPFSSEDQEAMRAVMTPAYQDIASFRNPCDLTGSATDADFEHVLDKMLAIDYIDAALLLLLPYAPGISLQIGAKVAAVVKRHNRTVVSYVPDLEKYDIIIRGFELNGIPVGDTIEEAVQMLNGIRTRSRYLQRVGALEDSQPTSTE
ncbi:MAG: CoA-binding protein [Candidatus Thorarchaeota archaeon]|nr:MAG: CoA-binding protein [Candidatus Thorarchaeota archaeon]